MTKRVSKGTIIDQLSDKLRDLRTQEAKTLMDDKMSPVEKEKTLAMIEQERLKAKKLMGRAMLLENIKKSNRTPEELNIKI